MMKRILFFTFITIFLISCNNGAKQEMNRAVEVFFLGVLQVLNMSLFGISSLVLCILSITSTKPVFKILGGILLGIFFLFMSLGLMAVTRANPKHFDIYILFILEIVMIIAAFICLLIKPKNKPSKNNTQAISNKDSVEEVI